MKPPLALLALMVVIIPSFVLAEAQRPEHATHFSLSGGPTRVGNASGGSLSATSPYFSKSWAIRLTYLNLEEEFLQSSRFEKFDSQAVELSILLSQFITDLFRGYARVGMGIYIPNGELSKHLSLTASSALGLEMFPSLQSQITVFAELGGISLLSGRAELLPGQPFLASGLRGVTGINFYL